MRMASYFHPPGACRGAAALFQPSLKRASLAGLTRGDSQVAGIGPPRPREQVPRDTRRG